MAREDGRREREALRRRLYAPDASDVDRARYRAADRGADASKATAGVVQRRRRRRPVLVVLLVFVALAAVAAVAGPRWATSASVPAPTPIAMGGEDRGLLEDGLASGGAAGIAAYLVTHRSPPGLAGATRFDTVERWGVGDATVTLSPVAAESVEGRATVLLVLERDGDTGWTAFRRQVDSAADQRSGEQRLVERIRRGGQQQAGVLTTTTFGYRSGDRPVSLRISAPDGARWGVAVVFSD